MAMAAIDAVPFGGPAGRWKGQLLVSGRMSRGWDLGFVCLRRRAEVDEDVWSSSAASGAGLYAVSSRQGKLVKLVVSLATKNDGAWTGIGSSGERETKWNHGIEERGGDLVLDRQYCEVDNAVFGQNSQDGENIVPTECEGRLPSTSMEESSLRNGRRAFSSTCLLALATFPSTGDINEALAEGTQGKPEKKKGRAPSSPYDEDRLLEQNRRMQRLNNAPTEFPGFVREGFQVKVITSDKYVTSKSGLIYYDMVVGNGDLPQDGQQVIFHYTGYNESGRRVDSSYQQGRPARTRVGIQGMIPGFEEGIKSMRAGGRRIIIVPPELGPPVGPSTFFSAKQFEVFDVELLEAKDCSRRTLLFYSDVVCE